MALTDYLNDRCTVQRKTDGRGPSGEVIPTWADHLTRVACRYLVQDERVASPQGWLVVTTVRLIVWPGQDITTADRVSSVTLDDGSTVGPFDILSVVPRRGASGQNHIMLRLEKVA
jgi:head-tail adaptor